MREKRLNKFKKHRQKKMRRIFLALVTPAIIALLGYLVAAVLILPAM